MDSIITINTTGNPSNTTMNEDSSNQNSINTVNQAVVIEKKKRGRKKTIKTDIVLSNDDAATTTVVTENTEKKIRKKRSKKNTGNTVMTNIVGTGSSSNSNSNEKSDACDENEKSDTCDGNETNDTYEENAKVEVVSGVKVRKRRVCKSKNIDANKDANKDANVIIDPNNIAAQSHTPSVEEKVVKKRGRKPKGGKIITQKLEENNNNNEIPNIILHLKCSLNDIHNKTNEKSNSGGLEENQIESYNNSTQLKGSDIFIKNMHSTSIAELKNSSNTTATATTDAPVPIYNDSLSHLFKVYNPDILPSSGATNSDMNIQTTGSTIHANTITNANTNTNTSIPSYLSNEILNNRSGMFNGVYSPDINLYNTEYDNGDDEDGVMGTCKNEKEIWRKISQLKISFHKSDICKSIGGTQRSACFWCTCEFDSPAIYIPKTLTKDVYNVYGCFCSPECSAAFLMNENIDTSTKFERYHLLNLLYGKIYKYEKSIKIAPNPFYLLNKFYGNLTIQEYRKLFQSDHMIYVVNKPLTHILPELYEDNNDFLLNSKIIPTNSVNIKKNKPLKSNIINNAFGITAGGR